MTEQELQIATVRMKLFDAAHADVLHHLEGLTGLSRGTLVHALDVALKHSDKQAAALRVFDLWLEWHELVKKDAGGYENFAVFVRKQLATEVVK